MMKLTVGMPSGHNACNLYDKDEAVCSVFGVPLNTRVQDVPRDGKWKYGIERAEFIVKAVNSHDKMVEALRKWMAYDEMLRGISGSVILSGDLPSVDNAYDECFAATERALEGLE